MQSWIVILHTIATKTKYINGLNVAPDITIGPNPSFQH